MKSLFAALALASFVLPGAAFAADGDMEKCCCCKKMKHEGADCCDKDKKVDEAGAPDHSDHAGHAGHETDAPAK